MLLERVAADACQHRHLFGRRAAMFADMLHNAHRKLRHFCQKPVLNFHFFLKVLHLLVQGAQKKAQPGLPMGRGAVEAFLSLPQCHIIALFVVFDDIFQRAIGYIGIAATQKQQRAQKARQAPVAVLKRVNGQKNHRENADNQQWVQALGFQRGVCPLQKLAHPLWRFKGRGRFKNNAERLAIFVKGDDMVGRALIVAAMPCVLLAVAQQVSVQLADIILRQRNLLPKKAQLFQGLGIADHFLLVACGKRADGKVCQKFFHIRV